jgi:O-acetylhomoserine/O-acetylserine sulfhydrylase-like pyridoxal-dependent enzyme
MQWLQAIKSNTRAVFVETIANPVTQIADLNGIGDLCESKGLGLHRRQYYDVTAPFQTKISKG